MKAFSKLLVAGLIMFGLLSCSKDEKPDNRDNRQTNESVYLSFKLEFPATRSSTDDNGSNASPETEVGTSAENKVGDVKIILVDPNAAGSDSIITSSVEDQTMISGTTVYTVRFKSNDLVNFADETDSKDVRVYAYCNPYSGISETNFDGTFAPSDIAAARAIWTNNKFFMSNAKIATASLPKKADLAACNTPDNACELGDVYVERAAARFDIATDAAYTTAFNLTNSAVGEDVNIELKEIALFNMSKACYNFRRVSADGTNTSWQICGTETSTNYVVDTDWENKVAGTDHFFYTTFDNLDWKNFSEITANDNWSDATHTTAIEYHPWRYAIENTIPKGVTVTENITTGVAFRGLIVDDGCEASLANEINTSHPQYIYVFDNVLYGSWERVGRAANQGTLGGTAYTTGTSANLFPQNDILKARYDAAEAEVTSANPINVVAKDFGFKVFKYTDGVGYRIYYNYYNRHNDNGDANVIGPMEFAVVRNNVYKLAVTKIEGFGDGEWPVPGDDPVETDDKYFEVTVKVLPWVVRVNDIEF